MLSVLSSSWAEAVRSFLVDPACGLLFLRTEPEAQILAAKLLSGVEADAGSDELFFVHTGAFDDAEQFYAGAAQSIRANIEEHQAGFAAHGVESPELPMFEPRAHEGLVEVEFACFMERTARALSKVCSRVALILNPDDESDESNFLASVSLVAASTGLSRVKYVVLTNPQASIPEALTAPQRLNVVDWGFDVFKREPELYVDLVRSSGRRVLVARSWPAVSRDMEPLLMAAASPGVAVEVIRLSLPSEATHDVAGKACTALTRWAGRCGEDVSPRRSLAGTAQFADLCEQLAELRNRARRVVVVVVESAREDETHPRDLANFVLELEAAAASPRVRYLILERGCSSELPALVEAPRRVASLELKLDAEVFQAHFEQQLAAPELPVAERIRSLSSKAAIAARKGDIASALTSFESVLVLCEDADDRNQLLLAWLGIGDVLVAAKRWADAESAFVNALSIALDAKLEHATAQALTQIGHARIRSDRSSDAVECYRTAADIYAKLESSPGCLYVLTWLGEAQRRDGEHARTLETWTGALIRARNQADTGGDHFEVEAACELLERLARLHHELGDSEAEKLVRRELAQLSSAPVFVPEHP